ncbi:MAG TPA: PAS domain S-box protein [Vicinamibacterales bacterium]
MARPDAAALRLAAVVESSDDAIMSEDLNGIIDSWNRAATHLFGYTAGEAIGQPMDVIIPDSERHAAARLSARVRAGEPVGHFQTYRKRRDGRLLPVSLALSPIRSPEGHIAGVSTIARDISAQLVAERETMRLAAIVDSSDDAIVSKDLNSIIQTWNSAAERMFGYTPEEAVGRSIRIIIPPDRQSEEDHVLDHIRRGIPVSHFETVRVRKDGSLIDISLTVSPIRNAEGRVVGASKIARDISAQKELLRKLGEANRIKDEFLATLSHELRTPLNAVLGYTQMLRSGRIADDRRQQVIEIIERNAHLLSQLVSDVLDVSSIVTGKIRLKTAPTDLLHVARAAVDVVRPSMDARNLQFTLTHDDRPMIAIADADRLQQAFWNLLSNAVKFTPEGGSIAMDVSRTAAGAEITVTDTGIGIPQDFLPHMFERFRQYEGGARREYGGLGLGLSLVRYFIELHGGQVSAHSDGPGAGATFRLTLPLASGDEQSS